ncbi:hypothetical protein Ndes2526B_g06893 [Nannochloris sp. 'desiccata']|nr:hypothetical protein KSW81_005008 [Chlorella desiccata (nom. nud.)]KAH7618000.1 putative DNA polymerase lambda [Chlorella desiccata (nom. nud.)]
MMKRIVEQGGTLDESVVPGATTHIICPPRIPRAAMDAALPNPTSIDKEHHPSSKYELVTQQFVAQSIIKGKRQNEADFRPVVIEPASPSAAAAPPAAPIGFLAKNNTSHPVKRQKLDGSAEEEQEDRGVLTPASKISRPPSATQKEKKQVDEEKGNEPCIIRRQGSEWVAIQGRKPRYTGGNTGVPWGSYGVWDEPFNREKALQTVEVLRKHWYAVPATSIRNVGSLVENETIEADKEDDTGKDKATISTTTSGICPHIACRNRNFCLIQLLEDFKNKVYVPGRDQFKIKAIDKAQQMLIMYTKPLDVDADVDAVGLGAKSSEKVKELLRTNGQMERAENAGRDDRHTAYSEFLKVWGVGPSIAEKWYSLGCRTIQDVEKKVQKLTEQQKCGLKFFNDFEVKIPREEISIAESIVREATFELVEQLGASDPEKTYCFATGSYRRGKAESSDIDILIVLPDSMPIQDCHEFLQQLLTILIDQKGLLIDEMGPREVRSSWGRTPSTHASWMGVCRVPGHPRYRRIDFKLYTAQHGPTAVNYFANSQSFCRATRHWANTAGVASKRAKKLNPVATGFKISDLEMCPMVKRYVGGGDGSRKEETVPLEPVVQLTCESDLYELIGLSYVPVTLRYFHDYF